MSSLDIRKLLDLDSINHLLDLFTDLTGVSAIIVDTKGNYVSKKSNYSRHCDLIHSVPDGLKACEKFAAELGALAVKDGTFAHGWCPFLLYDSTAPIMVKGEVVGFVGMGQILPEPPDMEKHRQIAKRMGLDQEAFLDSIRELKMMSLEEFKKITNIFGALASILSHIGLKRLESEKQADQLSREMELIVQNLPIGVNLLSPDLDMLLLNPFLEERMGLTTEQVKGKKCYDVVGDYRDDPNRKGTERICDKCPAMRALRSGRPQKQVRTVRPDFVVENTSVPIVDAEGKTIRLMEIILDITEKKNLEAQLLHAQKMEAIGTLAGGVSHDFNNILTGILGFTQLLMNKESLSGDVLSDLKRIEHEVKRAADLTTQLLTFSRRLDSQRKPTDLNKTVKTTTSMLARTIPKTIAIETALAGDLKTIYADPGQSEQILMNLAINARDAILQKGEHGTIRIETANVALDDQYCRLHVGANPGRYALLKVSDTGSGISPDIVSRIFDPFFTTKDLGEGTGLGLAMVYGIVKAHEGYVTVQSDPGEGTVFEVFLPLVEDVVFPEEKEEEITTYPGGTETILMVDDEETILLLSKATLSAYGYKVITSPDGQSALDTYRSTTEIDLVILDLNMPRMSGIECLQRLLKIDPSVKVIICSGYAPEKLTSEIVGDYAIEFLTKPFDIKTLLRTVREALDT